MLRPHRCSIQAFCLLEVGLLTLLLPLTCSSDCHQYKSNRSRAMAQSVQREFTLLLLNLLNMIEDAF